MNGVTGRMGTNQHLMQSVLAIAQQGGVRVSDQEVVVPDPVLVGRNSAKLQQLSRSSGVRKWTTNLEEALADCHNSIYFDSQTSSLRASSVKKAIAAGKHVYCEKPAALTADQALQLYSLAQQANLKNGVVQDKLWLPGVQKLKTLTERGSLGEILSIRGEFGYWVFAGNTVASQRPSWNYRKEEGGGIILDMFPHWRYLLDHLFGEVEAVCCTGATHLKRRWDEEGQPYDCTAEDAAYATFELEGGILATFNSSWSVRVRRDDLFTLQVDGTRGSAVAGLRKCMFQPLDKTPRPTWDPIREPATHYLEGWTAVSQEQVWRNPFRIQWELFLQHVLGNESFPWTLLEGAKGVQLAEKALESWQERAWIKIPPLQVSPQD